MSVLFKITSFFCIVLTLLLQCNGQQLVKINEELVVINNYAYYSKENCRVGDEVIISLNSTVENPYDVLLLHVYIEYLNATVEINTMRVTEKQSSTYFGFNNGLLLPEGKYKITAQNNRTNVNTTATNLLEIKGKACVHMANVSINNGYELFTVMKRDPLIVTGLVFLDNIPNSSDYCRAGRFLFIDYAPVLQRVTKCDAINYTAYLMNADNDALVKTLGMLNYTVHNNSWTACLNEFMFTFNNPLPEGDYYVAVGYEPYVHENLVGIDVEEKHINQPFNKHKLMKRIRPIHMATKRKFVYTSNKFSVQVKACSAQWEGKA